MNTTENGKAADYRCDSRNLCERAGFPINLPARKKPDEEAADFRHGTVPPPEERAGFPLDLPKRESV
jgi:hypothetical protein